MIGVAVLGLDVVRLEVVGERVGMDAVVMKCSEMKLD